MMEIEAAAAAAVGMLTPYLIKIGESAADKIGEVGGEATGKLLDWMRRRLTGRAKDALVDLERVPASTDNEADLRKQLTRLLQSDPNLAVELQELVREAATSREVMAQNVSGAGARAAQIKGDGNIVGQG